MPVAKLNGIDINYERNGSGSRLLYLNGSGTTIERTRPMLAVYEKHFDVLILDQRGLGLTEIPPGPYSMADYAADAVALADHVGWDTFRVIGGSFGGMVAQELAVTVPDRVERLALLCTSPGGAGGSSYPLHELRSLTADDRAAVAMRIMDTRFTPEWLESHPSDRMFVEAITANPGVAPGSEAERGEIEQLEARRHHDVWQRLDRITAPTFIAAGRYDGIAPPENSERIAERIPDSTVRIYEGGHGFFAQDPAAIPDVLEFLQG